MNRRQTSKRRSRGHVGSTPRQHITVKSVLDKLDAVDDSQFRNRRAAARHVFRHTMIPVRVRHPGGSISDSCVATRNLSNTGVGFLYNGFLHNGTEVSLTLPRRDGSSEILEGHVLHCRHIAGVFHQVGVRFSKRISSKHYVSDETTATALATQVTAVSTMTFAGRLLVIDGQPMDRALVAHHFRGTEAKVVAVESLGLAIAKLMAAPDKKFDAVLCELDVSMPGEGIAITFDELRSAGHAGPIIIATPTTAEASVREALFEAGAAAVMTKPYDRTELEAALSHGAKIAGIEKAVEVAETGIFEVDALTKMVEAVKKRRAS